MDHFNHVEQNQNKSLIMNHKGVLIGTLKSKINKVLKSLLSAGVIASAVNVVPASARQSISREKESVAIQSWQSVFNSGTIIGTSKQVADQKTVFIRGYNDIPYQIVEGASGSDTIELSIHTLDTAQAKKVTQSAARNIKDKTGIVVNFVTNQEKAPQDMRVLATIATEGSLTRDAAVLLSHAFIRQADQTVSEVEFPDIETYIEHKPLIEKAWGVAQTQGRDITSVQEKILLSLYRTHGSATALVRFAETESDSRLMAKEIDAHFTQSTQSLNSARRGTNYNNIGDIELFFDELGLIQLDERRIFEGLANTNMSLKVSEKVISAYVKELDLMIDEVTDLRVSGQDQPRFIAAAMQYLTILVNETKRLEEYAQEFVTTNSSSLQNIRNMRSHANTALHGMLTMANQNTAPALEFRKAYATIQKRAIEVTGGDASSTAVELNEVKEGGIEAVSTMLITLIEQNNIKDTYATVDYVLQRFPHKKEEFFEAMLLEMKKKVPAWANAGKKEYFALFSQVSADHFNKFYETTEPLNKYYQSIYDKDMRSGKHALISAKINPSSSYNKYLNFFRHAQTGEYTIKYTLQPDSTPPTALHEYVKTDVQVKGSTSVEFDIQNPSKFQFNQIYVAGHFQGTKFKARGFFQQAKPGTKKIEYVVVSHPNYRSIGQFVYDEVEINMYSYAAKDGKIAPMLANADPETARLCLEIHLQAQQNKAPIGTGLVTKINRVLLP